MENEDKLIKELLLEGVEKAPQGFTDQVMQTIAAAEAEKQNAFNWNKLQVPSMIIGSILLFFAIIYFVTPEFYSRLYLSLSGYALILTSQLSSIFGSFSLPISDVQINWLLVEVGAVIVALIALERFFFIRKRTLSIFMI